MDEKKEEIIENPKEKMKMYNEYVKDIVREKVKLDESKAEKTILMTPEGFAKIFSPERMKLLLRIKHNNISNIYQLAKGLERKYKAVYRDIKLLEGFGIIKLRKKDNRTIPFIEDSIKMPELAAG